MKRLFARILCLVALLSALGAAHAANPYVELETDQGNVVLELYPDKAPKTVENFLQYVRDGHYVGTIFHRVIPGFMVQGGGFDASMREKSTRPPIENEARNGLKNDVGTIAMARTPAPHSASAQFFVNVAANRFLDYPSSDGWGYAVFGKVVRGMDVISAITRVPTRNLGMHQNVPVTPVMIRGARVLDALPPAAASKP